MSVRIAPLVFAVTVVLPLQAQPLPGTKPLTMEGDIPIKMVQTIDRFLIRETEASIERRVRHWNGNCSCPEVYEQSVARNRGRFRKIIDRWSRNPSVRLTNQTHREMIYRMAGQVGRHIIGYEVQKVLAAVDWFARQSPKRPIGVIGYGEGGLIALYSAAAGTRIAAAAVSGYFDSRQALWQEPFYRNVWGLLDEFGDAEIATLIAPCSLIVEASRGPEVPGPPPPSKTHRDAAAPGRLTTRRLASVRREVKRARQVYEKLHVADRLALVVSGNGEGEPWTNEALSAFLHSLDVNGTLKPPAREPESQRAGLDPALRQYRQFKTEIEFFDGVHEIHGVGTFQFLHRHLNWPEPSR